MSKRAFLICPVRGHDISETEAVVQKLESDGWKVHWPPRDTDQTDTIGLQICGQNRAAIIAADRVFIVWNGESKGSLFDLGVAWANNKPLTVLSFPMHMDGKSFTKMILAWQEETREVTP